MQTQRSAFLPALVLLTAAICLSACGVKGELERPAGPAGAAPTAATPPAPAPSESTRKVFLEQSVVRSERPQGVLPTMPPKQWEKSGDYQPAREKSAVRQSPLSKPDPDKPFVLDWLL